MVQIEKLEGAVRQIAFTGTLKKVEEEAHKCVFIFNQAFKNLPDFFGNRNFPF